MWLTKRSVKFREYHPLVRRYLVEAIFGLLAARLSLRLVPFQWLTPYFNLPARSPEATFARRRQIWKASLAKTYTPQLDRITGEERQKLREGIPRLINEAAWFLPGETACFARAITAQGILRRLGIATTLFYGATTLPEGNLTAHVWLEDDGVGIIGHDTARDYRILARYPAPKTDPRELRDKPQILNPAKRGASIATSAIGSPSGPLPAAGDGKHRNLSAQ
jgi:hypothetical protein